MEEFKLGHQNPKYSLLQMNSNMELFNSMGSLEPTFNTPLHGIMPFHDQIPIGPNTLMFDPMAHFFASGMGPEPEIMANSSPSVSGTDFLGHTRASKKHQEENFGGKKRKRISEKELEKPREVVHVRAKRGQATDSHSLAERLRREKINDKLRCLQDLVPGCYKTMGMAVMLDVIINYVRSLQNQIDFLSMKLSAASAFYDFNSSEAEAIETLQGTTAYEAGQIMEKLVGEGYGGISQFQTPWPL
ncbi:hypothetical protein ACS0TY_033301 [Phlomoides rotata]